MHICVFHIDDLRSSRLFLGAPVPMQCRRKSKANERTLWSYPNFQLGPEHGHDLSRAYGVPPVNGDSRTLGMGACGS